MDERNAFIGHATGTPLGGVVQWWAGSLFEGLNLLTDFFQLFIKIWSIFHKKRACKERLFIAFIFCIRNI
jgi:hypothetical protein